eukprot:TRINITY_DN491_c0_g1_i1.p1 TRINITY_DN491_c0_g1~~TRINITY_DN491_c0_g1_i1.p1  ORF type:complete len:812 (+),score=249.30 TRINITY_DN491_c0_g1_i1:84-2438(+)
MACEVPRRPSGPAPLAARPTPRPAPAAARVPEPPPGRPAADAPARSAAADAPGAPGALPSLRRAPQGDLRTQLLLAAAEEEQQRRGLEGDEELAIQQLQAAQAAELGLLQGQKAQRRRLENSELTAREEMEEEEDTVWVALAGPARTAIVCAACADAEAQQRALVRGAEQGERQQRAGEHRRGAEAADRAAAVRVHVTEWQGGEVLARQEQSRCERRARRELQEAAEAGWLQARGRELRRLRQEQSQQDAAESAADEQLAAQMCAQLRRQRMDEEQRRLEEEQAERDRAARAEQELADALAAQLSAERTAVWQAAESARGVTATAELGARHAAERERLLTGEALTRDGMDTLQVYTSPTLLGTDEGEGLVRAQILAAEGDKRKALNELQGSEWLQARRRETVAEDRERLSQELLDKANRDADRKAELLRAQQILSYMRAEAEDRSVVLGEYRHLSRLIQEAHFSERKLAFEAQAEREVMEEWERNAIRWTATYWSELEGGEARGRLEVCEEEEDERGGVEMDERQSYLRTRAMELRRQQAADLIAGIRERAAAALAEADDAARCRKFEEEVQEFQRMIVLRKEAGAAEDRARVAARLTLAEKWAIEDQAAKDAEARRVQQRQADLERRLSEIRRGAEEAARRREAEERVLGLRLAERSEERCRTTIVENEAMERDELEGKSPYPPPRRVASAGAKRLLSGTPTFPTIFQPPPLPGGGSYADRPPRTAPGDGRRPSRPLRHAAVRALQLCATHGRFVGLGALVRASSAQARSSLPFAPRVPGAPG